MGCKNSMFDTKSKDQAVEDDRNPYLPFTVALKLGAIGVLLFVAGLSFGLFYATTTVCPL